MKTLLRKIFERLLVDQKVKNQFDFGNQLGYNSGYMTTALKSNDIPKKMQNRLVETFGISADYLVNGEGEMFMQKESDNSKAERLQPQNNTGSASVGEKTSIDENNNGVNSQFTKNQEDMNLERLIRANEDSAQAVKDIAKANLFLVEMLRQQMKEGRGDIDLGRIASK